jgi:hypothetical protein
MKKVVFLFFIFSLNAFGQDAMYGDDVADFELGGDIFNDYSEGIESAKILERENYFNYSNFFSVDFFIGWTTFDGNRGMAYQENSSPGFSLGTNYYFEPNVTFGIGFAYSQNYFTIDQPVNGYPNPQQLPGNITVDNWRFFGSMRYYIDTTNLGSALTFANPYFVGRLEYWGVGYKFKNQPTLPSERGKGMGWAGGIGLQFPLKMKTYNFGVEFLVHSVNWSDRFTQAYAPLPQGSEHYSGYGYANLNGLAFDLFMGFNLAF